MRRSLNDEDVRLIGEPLTAPIVAAAMEVHRRLGPGLLENAYRLALVRELELRELSAEVDAPVPFIYRDTLIPCVFRADLIVNGKVLVELKSVDALRPVHRAQVITYLRLSGLHVGLLVNFNCALLRDGLKRFVA